MATVAPVRLTVHAGPSQPVPLPGDLTARLRSVRVTETDTDRSVFSLVLDAGRGRTAARDVPSLRDGPLTPGARISIVVTFGGSATVLADGFVTEIDMRFPDRPGGSASLDVTAEDAGLLLDLEERDVSHPNLGDRDQVTTILARYADRGIAADVATPDVSNQYGADKRVLSQHDTDLRHLSRLARRHDFSCFMIPGPSPGSSTCYWGPSMRTGRPQPALSVDLGAHTNVLGAMSFRTSALGPATVRAAVRPQSGGTQAVSAVKTRREKLAAVPLSDLRTAMTRVRRQRISGSDASVATGRAQAELDRAMDAVTGTATVDGSRYGAVIRPRALIGVRGAGWAHDGLWYVSQVTHDLEPGSYRQTVTLGREGYGSTVTTVTP